MTFGAPGDKTCKLVLIGDGAVGKTSIRERYLGKGFRRSQLATIGVDFAQKFTTYKGVNVRHIIWDLAGQPSYASVRKHYYQGSSAIILVYSVVERDSFDNASKWLVEAHKHLRGAAWSGWQGLPTAIIGNKIDLRESGEFENTVTTEEGQVFAEYFAQRLDAPVLYKETSALTGENIDEVFSELNGLMFESEKKRPPRRVETANKDE
ncbi:MAG: Rab family GTPase [Candidatus Thorarchaeota archaeon]|jgi:small GTP-binding protein